MNRKRERCLRWTRPLSAWNCGKLSHPTPPHMSSGTSKRSISTPIRFGRLVQRYQAVTRPPLISSPNYPRVEPYAVCAISAEIQDNMIHSRVPKATVPYFWWANSGALMRDNDRKRETARRDRPVTKRKKPDHIDVAFEVGVICRCENPGLKAEHRHLRGKVRGMILGTGRMRRSYVAARWL